MDLNALRLFVATVEAGSLSEAARRTGVPLPTLSRRVRGLEDELGVRLLERGPHKTSLTDVGARLFATAEPALAQLAQAAQGLHDATGLSGRVRVSLPPHFAPLRDVFEAFSRQHAGVRLDLFVTDRRVDLVADGVDVAIRVGDAGRSSYVGRTLARYRHVLVAAPALLAGADLCRPDDVTRLPCACWRSGAPPAWQLGDATVALDPLVCTNDYDHLLRLALDGRVVTELPPFLAHGPLQRGELVEVLPHAPLPPQALRALVADTRLLSPLVRRFLDVMAERVPAELRGYTRG